VAEPFLSEIRIVSFNFPPKGWALCNGQFLPINQNQAMFSLLGTTFGGNGQTTFALPNFRGQMPMHFGAGHTLGERAGSSSVTLSVAQMPAHTHQLVGSRTPSGSGVTNAPLNRLFSRSTTDVYSSAPVDSSLAPNVISNLGGSQPHTNMQPYIVLNFIVALQGIFPSQN
jgi:microcystin-dependent protein